MCVHFLYEIYLLLYEMPNHFFPNSVFIYVDGLHNSSHGDSLPMLISNVCGIPVADRLLIRAIQILTPAILLEMIMRTVPPDFGGDKTRRPFKCISIKRRASRKS